MVRKFLTDISLNNNRITNLNNPVNQLDGVNKGFLDETNVDFHQIFTFNFSDNTNSIPATGEFTTDTSISSATQLKVNNTDLLSFLVEDSIVNTSNYSKNQLRIQEADDNNAYVIFEVDSYTQQSGYYDLNGQVIKSSFNGGSPTLSEDCKIIFLNNYTFTGTSATSSLNEGFVPDDGIVGTGSRSLLDDGTWGDTSNFGENIGTNDLTTTDNIRTLTLAGDLSSDSFNIDNNSGSNILKIQGDETILMNGQFQYNDGNQSSGYILTSDTNGIASWTASSNVISGDGNIYDNDGTISSSTRTVTLSGTSIGDTLEFKDGGSNDILTLRGNKSVVIDGDTRINGHIGQNIDPNSYIANRTFGSGGEFYGFYSDGSFFISGITEDSNAPRKFYSRRVASGQSGLYVDTVVGTGTRYGGTILMNGSNTGDNVGFNIVASNGANNYALRIAGGDYKISYNGFHRMILGGGLSTDGFTIRNSGDTEDLFSVRGNNHLVIGEVSSPDALLNIRQKTNNALFDTINIRNLGDSESFYRLDDLGNHFMNSTSVNNGKLNLDYSGTTVGQLQARDGNIMRYGGGFSVLHQFHSNTGDADWSFRISPNSNAVSFRPFGIGSRDNPQAVLDIRADGSLSTDDVLRIRNSADTRDLFKVQGDGRVGVGTNTPATKLEVDGGTIYVNTPTNEALLLDRASGQPTIKGGDGSSSMVIDAADAENLYLQNYHAGDLFMVTGGGNVGVDTITPDTKLHVVGDLTRTNLVAESTAGLTTINGSSAILLSKSLPTGVTRIRFYILAQRVGNDSTWHTQETVVTATYDGSIGTPTIRSNNTLYISRNSTTSVSITGSAFGVLRVNVTGISGQNWTWRCDYDIRNIT